MVTSGVYGVDVVGLKTEDDLIARIMLQEVSYTINISSTNSTQPTNHFSFMWVEKGSDDVIAEVTAPDL